MVKVMLNNETHEVADAIYLQAAIEQWHFGDQKIAVAINGEFIPRSTYTQVTLKEGDQVDIVKPVGGG